MFLLPPRGNLRIFLGSFLGFLGLFGSGGNRNRAGAGPGRGRGRGRNLGSEKKNLGSEKENLGSGFLGPFQGRPMALQETYGNWLGPGRLQRQPGIYSAPRTMPPPGDFRPASPDSFEDDYDDVSMAGSEQGPQPKGLYLLAGAPGSSPAPSLPDPEAKIADSHPKIAGSDPKFRNSDPKFRNSAPKFGISDPKIGDFDPKSGDFAPKLGDLAPKRRGRAALGALALLGLAWAAALGLGLGKYLELREELELLRANFSRIWDSVQQDQIGLRFGIRQHQLEQQELAEQLCRALGSPRPCDPGWLPHGSSWFLFPVSCINSCIFPDIFSGFSRIFSQFFPDNFPH
ncbi:uncharacterized protein [Agelaius tricolor]|uniref:uncharacterized protein isoform X6 n=1 Tax=Agelaius tricolor TaxID=9191 RepID=UPI0039F16CFA